MAIRLDTTATTGDSAVFTPDGDVILQMTSVDPKAKVAVMARVDDAAEWVQIGELSNPVNRFLRFAAFPKMMLRVVKNTDTKALKVWSNV